MADWYVSSTAWTAIPQFAASTAYTVGQIVRPLTTPAAGHEYAFRCTTAGTSSTEPSWPAADSATVTSGGATFTNVSSQGAYGWNAPAGTLYSISNQMSNRPVAGDRIFLSSDHSENVSPINIGFNNSTGAYGLLQIISVNRSGSVPPATTDYLAGASLTYSSNPFNFEAYCNMFWQGVTVTYGGTGSWAFNSSASKSHYMKNCALVLSTAAANQRIVPGSQGGLKIILDSTTFQVGATSQSIAATSNNPMDLTWINTPSAIAGATVPANLFFNTTLQGSQYTIRGVDLSAITGTLFNTQSAVPGMKALVDSCKIAAGVTRYTPPPAGTNATVDEIELVNCHDGTNVINERYTPAGTVTTDRTTYLTGGAQDDIGNYALKLASSTRSDKRTMPLDCFAFDVENTAIGAAKTATVEIVSSASLNNDDISLLLEYMGTSGNSIASFVSTLPSPLATVSAVTTSTATWTSPPSTPVYQKLQATFTPQRSGRVRGLVRLGKPSSTVWVNPQITIT